jgi:PadR family transcriptional regulator, regulatory protein PadR
MAMSTMRGDEIRGHIEGLVLSVLSAGESHGFQIMRRIEERGCGALRLKEGTLYPVLYRLERDGYVKARWESEEEAAGRRGPRRRLYQLTSKGRGKLDQSRADWKRFVTIIGGILEAPA